MVCQTRVTIEGRCHRCTHGEWRGLIEFNVLFYTANDEQMDKTLSALSIYEDMIWFRYTIRCLTDKVGLLISQVGIQYTKHLRRSISVCL
jgi:hypothetical protein